MSSGSASVISPSVPGQGVNDTVALLLPTANDCLIVGFLEGGKSLPAFAKISHCSRYSCAIAGSLMSRPLFVCVHNPVSVQLVEPVHTACGTSAALQITMNLLCARWAF